MFCTKRQLDIADVTKLSFSMLHLNLKSGHMAMLYSFDYIIHLWAY